MTATAKTTKTEPTACACSQFEALDLNDVTEADVEAGDIQTFATDCTASTRNVFAPGHDAKLKSFLIKAELAGLEIRRMQGGMAINADAVSHANEFGFGHMVAAGIEKGRAKAEARAARKAAKATKTVAEHGRAKAKSLAETVAAEQAKHQAEQTAKVAELQAAAEWDDAPAAPVADTEWADAHTDEDKAAYGEPTKAKVGRWTYEGTVFNGEFTYTDGKGKTQTTRKFTEV